MFNAWQCNPFRRLRCLRRMALGGLLAAGCLLTASVLHHQHYFAPTQTSESVVVALDTNAPEPCESPRATTHTSAHAALNSAGDVPSHGAHTVPQSCPLCLTLGGWALASTTATDVPPANPRSQRIYRASHQLPTRPAVPPYSASPRAPPAAHLNSLT